MNQDPGGCRGAVPAMLLALLATAASLAPVLADPARTLVCNYIHPDCLSNHWLLIRVAEALTAGAPLLHNDRYYWPVGDAPWLAGNGSEGFFYAPFSLVMPWPMAANAYVACVLAFNGAATWAWCRALGASARASWAAAPTGALSIYALHELSAGRFSQADCGWAVMFLAAWLRLLARPSAGRAAAAAALLAVTSLGYWYYGLFCVIAGAALLAAAPWDGPWEGSREGSREGPGLRARIAPLAGFSAGYLLLIAPLLYVFIAYWAQIPGTDEDVFPHPEAVRDSGWPEIPFLVAGGRHAGRALPALVCLAALGCLPILREPGAARRRVLALIGIGLLFTALMAGPLIPGGPYELLYGLAGPLRRFWWPYRHVMIVNLAWIGLGALGLDRLLRRFDARPRLQGALALGLAVSVPLQLEAQGAPWHVQFTGVALPHPFYSRLAEIPGEVLIEPPLSPALASSQTMLIYEVFHQKKLLSGHALWVDRVRPDAWDAFVAANSFLSEMQRLERAELPGRFAFDGADLEALRAAGAGLVALNPEYFPGSYRALIEAYTLIFDALFGAPVVSVGAVQGWDMRQWSGVTEVEFPAFSWPQGLRSPQPGLPVQAPHPASPVFEVPGPMGQRSRQEDRERQ